MNGVKFNNLHSYDDYSLILVDAVIDAPKPKTEKVNIPGADGVLDFSEYFGEIKYKNRNISFDFKMKADISNFMNLFSTVQNALHGKTMQVTLDVDSSFYYIGRVTVDKWLADRRVGKINISVDAEPYKLKNTLTEKTTAVTSTATVAYLNTKKSVVPEFTTDAAFTIQHGTNTFSHGAGTFVIPDILFVAGDNQISYTGTGTVTVKYREGSL